MAIFEAARQDARFYVLSVLPDICLTPLGSAMVPVPYMIVGQLHTSTGTSPDVNFAGVPAFTREQSRVSKVFGDEPGTGGGLVSGTVGGECEALIASRTLRSNGQQVVRVHDLFWMNNRNTIGTLLFTGPTSGGSAESSGGLISGGAAGDGGGGHRDHQGGATTGTAAGGNDAGADASSGVITVLAPWRPDARDDEQGSEQGVPKVRLARFVGQHFETSKCFVLPSILGGLRKLGRYRRKHPRAKLLMVGHADRAGSADYNRTLSEERAASLWDYLRDDVEAWLAFYGWDKPDEKRFGTREDQHMLSALSDEAGTFYDGEPNGQADEPHRAAVTRFQQWANDDHQAGLEVDGACGQDTRRELIRAYMARDRATLAADSVVSTHGCGEFHPEVATADGVHEERNRRAEIFFFDGDINPEPVPKCPAPGCIEYPEWRRRVVETIILDGPPGDDEVTLTHEWPLVLWRRLPADTVFRLYCEGVVIQEVPAAEAEITNEICSIRFDGLSMADVYSLHATGGGRALELWNGRLPAGDERIAWMHTLDELQLEVVSDAATDEQQGSAAALDGPAMSSGRTEHAVAGEPVVAALADDPKNPSADTRLSVRVYDERGAFIDDAEVGLMWFEDLPSVDAPLPPGRSLSLALHNSSNLSKRAYETSISPSSIASKEFSLVVRKPGKNPVVQRLERQVSSSGVVELTAGEMTVLGDIRKGRETKRAWVAAVTAPTGTVVTRGSSTAVVQLSVTLYAACELVFFANAWSPKDGYLFETNAYKRARQWQKGEQDDPSQKPPPPVQVNAGVLFTFLLGGDQSDPKNSKNRCRETYVLANYHDKTTAAWIRIACLPYDSGAFSILRLYEYLNTVGKEAAKAGAVMGRIRDLNLLTHGFWNGPVLYPDDDEGDAMDDQLYERNPNDRNGRSTDFLELTGVEGQTGQPLIARKYPHLCEAFADRADFRLWGCFFQPHIYTAMMSEANDRVAKHKPVDEHARYNVIDSEEGSDKKRYQVMTTLRQTRHLLDQILRTPRWSYAGAVAAFFKNHKRSDLKVWAAPPGSGTYFKREDTNPNRQPSTPLVVNLGVKETWDNARQHSVTYQYLNRELDVPWNYWDYIDYANIKRRTDTRTADQYEKPPFDPSCYAYFYRGLHRFRLDFVLDDGDLSICLPFKQGFSGKVRHWPPQLLRDSWTHADYVGVVYEVINNDLEPAHYYFYGARGHEMPDSGLGKHDPTPKKVPGKRETPAKKVPKHVFTNDAGQPLGPGQQPTPRLFRATKIGNDQFALVREIPRDEWQTAPRPWFKK